MRKLMEFTEEKGEGNTGEHTESLKTLDEDALNDNKLVTSVEARLKNLRGLEREADDSAEYEDTEDRSTPPVPDDETEEDDSEADDSDDSDDSTPVDDSEDGKDPVTIPEAYVRAAIHQGWKQEDIDGLVKHSPDLALTTLTSCYNSVNNATKEWSELGRAKIEQERAAAEADSKSKDDSVNVDPLVNKLKETYGDDPLIDTVAELLKRNKVEQSKHQQDPRDLYSTATARANAAANASVDARVNAFFGSDAMKPYEEFYGKVGLSQSINDLTNGQQEHRLSVMEQAECILGGMRMRGMNPSIEEVLEKAHLVVTEPIREQVIRNSIKKTAKQRESSMMFRPAKSKKTSSAIDTKHQGKPKTRQELIERTEQRLAKVPGLRS
jgi:hypothetical protein